MRRKTKRATLEEIRTFEKSMRRQTHAADRMVPGEKRKRPGRGNLYDRKAAWKNARLQLLFIDDFGISRYSEEGMNILYQLVKMRADLGTSTLYTASMSQMNGVSI